MWEEKGQQKAWKKEVQEESETGSKTENALNQTIWRDGVQKIAEEIE